MEDRQIQIQVGPQKVAEREHHKKEHLVDYQKGLAGNLVEQSQAALVGIEGDLGNHLVILAHQELREVHWRFQARGLEEIDLEVA
jgi:hypothetical protein